MARPADIACACLVTVALLAACGGRPRAIALQDPRADEDNRQGAFESRRGELRAAQASFGAALQRSRSIDDARGQAVALLNLASVDTQRWAWARAQQRAEAALALAGDDGLLANVALARLAAIRSQRGDHDHAIVDARTAARQVDALRLRRRQRDALRGDRATTLAFALVRAGGPHCDEAQDVLALATEQYGRALDPRAQAALAHLGGLLALGRHDAADAETLFVRARDLDQAQGRPLDVADDLEALADAAALAGDPSAEIDWLSRALWARQSLDTPAHALFIADRLAREGALPHDWGGRLALLRTDAGDPPPEPPATQRPCD